MAYGTKYRIKWTTPTADCRLRLQQDGYSSGVTDLEPATETFTLEWKRTDANEDLTIPLKISTGTIRITGNPAGTQVKEVFDSGDTEWRVLFDRDTGGGYQLEWQGFVADDLYSDDPHRDYEAIELPVLDGLALLEDQDFDPSSANLLYTTVRNILRSLHDLPVAANMEWYPYRSGNQLSGNQLPLDAITTAQNAFDELEPIEGKEGFRTTDKRSKRRVLEAVLERFGMELFQSRGEWTVRQRHQIDSNGQIKMWPNLSAAQLNNPTTRDLNRSLGALPPREKPRTLVQRLRTAESVHSYEDLEELVRNGSFENGFTGWSTSTPGFSKVQVVQYNNTPLVRNNTQSDQQLAKLRPDYASGSVNEPVLEQELPAISHFAGPNAAYQIEWDVAVETQQAVPIVKVWGKTKGGTTYYAKPTQFTVQQEAAAAEDGEVFISSLPGTGDNLVLPKGSELIVKGSGFPFTTITLSENAYAGDEVLKGRIPSKIKTNNNQEVVAWIWSTQNSRLEGIDELPAYPRSAARLQPQRLLLPQVTPSGDKITEDFNIRFSAQVPPDNSELVCWVDHVQTELLVDGQPIKQTSYTALDDQSGRDIEITQLLGDGPTFEHPRALQLSGVDVTQDWQVGAYAAGDPRSGQLLEEVTAEAAMRQQRDTLQRRTHEVELRGSEELWPQDVFTIDGDRYTVSRLKRTFATSGDVAEVELSRLKDAGTSGLSRTFEMEAGDTAGGGGGTSGTSGGGTVGPTGSNVIELDASNSNVTERLPPPSSGATAVALRVDTSPGNTATLETQNTGSEEIRFAEGKNKSSTTLDVEQSLLLSSDGSDWYVEEGQGLRAEAETITTDGATKNSPLLKQTATYDSDPTSSVTSSDVSIERYVRTDNSGNAVLVYESGGTEIARLSSGGRFETRKDQEAFMSGSLSSGSGTNSLLFFEDANNSRSTTDLAKLTVKGSGVTITNPNTDEYVLDISGGGSSVGSLSDLSDVNSANRSDGNVLATGSSTLWREESITTLTQQHVDLNNLSDVGTAGVTNGNILIAGGVEYDSVGLDTAAGNHLDLADLKNTAYSSLTGTPSIAYNSTIPADNFTSTEVTNLRSGELDDGSTPWTSNNFFDAADARTAVEGTSDVTDLVSNATASVGYVPASDGTGGVSWDDPETHVHTRPIAGDGLDDSSGTFLIDVSDFAGHGLEDNNDNLRIDAANIGDGLDGGSGSDLSVDVSDFDGDGLTSSTNDLDVDSTVARTNIEETFKGADFYTTTFTTTNTSNGAANLQLTRSDDDSGWEISGPRTGESDKFKLYRKTPTASFNEVITATTSGNVGIGIGATSPSYTLEVSGDARSTGEVEAFLGSDRRLKTGLDPLDSALDKVDQLTGYGFDWREKDAVQPHKRGKTDVGLIAQEVEGVLPEAVREFQDGHSEGYKSVSYDKLVPLLIEAIKDLRSQVDQFQ